MSDMEADRPSREDFVAELAKQFRVNAAWHKRRADGTQISQADSDRLLAFLNATVTECGHPEAVMSRLDAWWTVVPQDELDGRTIADAYIHGDEQAVRSLLVAQYEATERSFARDTPGFLALLRSRKSS